jgi:hypothetical protein
MNQFDYQNELEWTPNMKHELELGIHDYPDGLSPYNHNHAVGLDGDHTDTVDVCLLEKYNRLLPPVHHENSATGLVLNPSNQNQAKPDNFNFSAFASSENAWESRIFCNESSDGMLCW